MSTEQCKRAAIKRAREEIQRQRRELIEAITTGDVDGVKAFEERWGINVKEQMVDSCEDSLK